MERSINYPGFIIAGIGFFLTRFTVTLVLYDNPVRFYLTGILPLVLGLGLAAFGVALAVADVEPALVRTTTLWCLIGFGTMLILVLLTVLGTTSNPSILATIRDQTTLSTFLIGGSVGGTLTGLYAARNQQQQRALTQQTNRLIILNRILRHEILNAVTAIRGYASTGLSDDATAQTVINDRSLDIQSTVEEIRFLTKSTGSDHAPTIPVNLHTKLTESIKTVTTTHPTASITMPDVPSETEVLADDRLSQVFTRLLENAVLHGRDPAPSIAVTVMRSTVEVRISDDGSGLPLSQQRLLEAGTIQPYDDPTTGFGLNIVRLLMENYDGTISTSADEAGATITLRFHRAASPDHTGPRRADFTNVRPALPHLLVGVTAAVIAGVVYGMVAEVLGGSIAGIGVFYGAANPIIGWLTHEFHSIVFGFVYLGMVSVALERYSSTMRTYVAVGIGWAVVLWLGAAGVIAPIWLQLLGVQAPIPNLSGRLLVSHLAWGLSLSVLTAWGYETLIPQWKQ